MRGGIIESANVDIVPIVPFSPTDKFGLIKPVKTLRTFDAYGFEKIIF